MADLYEGNGLRIPCATRDGSYLEVVRQSNNIFPLRVQVRNAAEVYGHTLYLNAAQAAALQTFIGEMKLDEAGWERFEG